MCNRAAFVVKTERPVSYVSFVSVPVLDRMARRDTTARSDRLKRRQTPWPLTLAVGTHLWTPAGELVLTRGADEFDHARGRLPGHSGARHGADVSGVHRLDRDPHPRRSRLAIDV